MLAEAGGLMWRHAGAVSCGVVAAPPAATGDAPGAGSCHDLLFSGTRESSGSRNVDTAPPGASLLRAPGGRAGRAPTHNQGPNGRFRSARKHAASTGRTRRRAQPARCVPASSPLSAVDFLQGVDLEIAFGDKAFQLHVFDLKMTQTPDVGRLQFAETAPVEFRLELTRIIALRWPTFERRILLVIRPL